MLIAITNREEIKKANEMFFNKLLKISNDSYNIFYSTAGGSPQIKIWYSEEFQFWWGNSIKIKENRYWNPFGLGKKPKEDSHVVGRCQINCAFEGVNNSLGGVFAKDSRGNYYLLHSGKFGGGTKGVGKSDFIDWYTGEPETVLVGNKELEFYIVTKISATDFFQNVVDYVSAAYDFKTYVGEKRNKRKNPVTRNPLKDGEYLGIKTYNLPERTITPTNDHARIAKYLIKELKSKKFNVKRDQFRDAYTINSQGKIDRVFEIKSSFDRQKLYTAIGQLMLHSLGYNSDMFFVINKAEYGDLLVDLKKISITCITFEWKDNKKKIKFQGLDALTSN